jgi:hypothetical protein
MLTMHILDIYSRISLDNNPWERYLKSGTAVFSAFVLCPFTIFLISSIAFIEQKANAWKFLYTMPTSRYKLYLGKLTVIVIIISATILTLFILLVASAYLLDFLYPEYEFAYHSLDLVSVAKKTLRSIIAILGVVGIQYFISMLSKHFILPIGIGVLGFIIAFLLCVANSKIALYIPFAYPMIVHPSTGFRYEHVQGEWLSNVEIYSILVFIVFVSIGTFTKLKAKA